MQKFSLAKIPKVDLKLELDDPLTREEIKKATMQLKVGKSPSTNGILAEVYQHRGEAQLDKLQDLFTNYWEKGTLLQDLMLNGLILTIAQENMPESQFGFRSNRGTIDMIFVQRQIQEKCREQTIGLYAAVIDLTKAFDTVNRDGLWNIMARLGCSPKFLTILCQLQDLVKHIGSLSGSFPISNSIKQGCVLDPHIVLHLLQYHAP